MSFNPKHLGYHLNLKEKFKVSLRWGITLMALWFVHCKKDAVSTPENYPNVLLIIADDLGKDAIKGYSEGTVKPNTKHLDQIRNSGIVFNNLWVYPTCSPTRASIITGKYGYRTNVKWANDVMSGSEKILQQYIKEETDNRYATAIVGKWHLSGEQSSFNPETLGIDYYAGLLSGAVQDYSLWQLTEDGIKKRQTDYITKVLTDLAIDWVDQQSKPWFLWLAYNAPHTPFHVPPTDMHAQGNLSEYSNGKDPQPYYMAAIEAMDHQIGRLLDSLDPTELDNTVIIFIGDNGSPNQVAQQPYQTNQVKGTLYQGGINVPMFISGKAVNRNGEDNQIICSTDLFCTIAELTGVSVNAIHDSKSFKSLLNAEGEHRSYQYAEMNDGQDDLWTISNGAHKLIVDAQGKKELYDLVSDPYEKTNLLNNTLTGAQEAEKTALENELLKIRN